MLADPPHGRGLTASERSRLEDLERSLHDDDPALADALRYGMPAAPPTRHTGATAVALAVAVLLVAMVAGLDGVATVGIAVLACCWAWQVTRRRPADRRSTS